MKSSYSLILIIPLLILMMFFAWSSCSDDDGDSNSSGSGDDTAADDDFIGDDDDNDNDDDTGPAPLPELAINCDDAKDDVYITPSNLPAYDMSMRGQIIRCAKEGNQSQKQLTNRFADIPGVTVTSGHSAYVISYRSEREPDVGGVGTARLLVPDTPKEGPLPLVVATHGTAGLADSCSPSTTSYLLTEKLALAWVASGYAVIAPDYAGLGNEGVQGYGNNLDTAHSVLDAARALSNTLTPGSMSDKAIIAGHSQGGGAALAAQALSDDYGNPDIQIQSIVSFAGNFSDGNETAALRYPRWPIIGGAGVARAVYALTLYANFANLYGEDASCDGFHPLISETVCSTIQTECVYSITSALMQSTPDYTPPNTIGELVDSDFRQEIVDCLDGTCTTRAQSYVDRAEQNVLEFNPAADRVLLIAGENDEIAPPTLQACIEEQLIEDGIKPEVCLLPGQTHSTLVEAGIGYAIDWATGNSSACPGMSDLPQCVRKDTSTVQ